jgi:hypothetical protein
MRWVAGLVAAMWVGFAGGARAAPVVLELFTSQGCSSCPPADALLGELAAAPGVLALDMHVDYWNGLGWRDPFALAAMTARQEAYAALLGQGEVYTPELVVGGVRGVVGSDRAAVAQAIGAVRAAAARDAGVDLRLERAGGRVVVNVGAGAGAGGVVLVGYEPRVVTRVRGGENGGRTLVETNVVRAMVPLGAWSGTAERFEEAAPAGGKAAVFLQLADGRIVAAAAE